MDSAIPLGECPQEHSCFWAYPDPTPSALDGSKMYSHSSHSLTIRLPRLLCQP